MVNGIWGFVRRFAASAAPAFWNHYTKIDANRGPIIQSELEQAVSTAETINGGLKSNLCMPLVGVHISPKGAEDTIKALDRKDFFRALLAIDGNTLPGTTQVCISLLKLAATNLCSETPLTSVRSVTYLALQNNLGSVIDCLE